MSSLSRLGKVFGLVLSFSMVLMPFISRAETVPAIAAAANIKFALDDIVKN